MQRSTILLLARGSKHKLASCSEFACLLISPSFCLHSFYPKATLVVLRVALMAARVTTGLPLPIPSFGIGADEEKLEAFGDALSMFDGALDSVL